jgi:hypothetical protein
VASVLALALLAPASAAAEDVAALNAKAKRLYEKGDFEAAEAAWQKAYEVEPTPVFLLSISSCRKKLGDKEGALAMVERYIATAGAGAIEEDLKLAKARAAELHIEVGRAAADRDECGPALVHFGLARERGAGPEAMVLQGMCLERLGRKAEARALYWTVIGPGVDAPADVMATARARLALLGPPGPPAAPAPGARRRFPWLAVGVGGGGAVAAALLTAVIVLALPRPDPPFSRATTLGGFEARF